MFRRPFVLSVTFLPRDDMCKRGISCPWCLSVHPSLWCIVSRRLNISSNFFSLLSSPMTLVSCPRAPIPNSQGNPFSGGGAKYTGRGKLAIFDRNRRLSWNRCEIGRWLLWNVNRKSWVPDRMVLFSMTLSDSNPDFKIIVYLQVEYLKNGMF